MLDVGVAKNHDILVVMCLHAHQLRSGCDKHAIGADPVLRKDFAADEVNITGIGNCPFGFRIIELIVDAYRQFGFPAQ